MKTIKTIDKKTKAKIRIFYFDVPIHFYKIMLDKSKLKGMSLLENDKSYIHFLNIKSKFYHLLSAISYTKKDFVRIKFTFEKKTNNKILSKC